MHTITVRPDTTTAWPEVRDAIRSASRDACAPRRVPPGSGADRRASSRCRPPSPMSSTIAEAALLNGTQWPSASSSPNAPATAVAASSSGIPAAISEPKTTSRMTTVSGSEVVSARFMSSLMPSSTAEERLGRRPGRRARPVWLPLQLASRRRSRPRSGRRTGRPDRATSKVTRPDGRPRRPSARRARQRRADVPYGAGHGAQGRHQVLGGARARGRGVRARPGAGPSRSRVSSRRRLGVRDHPLGPAGLSGVGGVDLPAGRQALDMTATTTRSNQPAMAAVRCRTDQPATASTSPARGASRVRRVPRGVQVLT